MNPIYILAIVIMVIAASLPVMLYVKIRLVKSFLEKAIVTTAKIFYAEKRHSSKSTYYFIRISYTTVDTGIE